MGTDPQGWVTDLAVPTALPHKAHINLKAGDGCYLPLPWCPTSLTGPPWPYRYERGSSHRGWRKAWKDGGAEGSKHLSSPPSQTSPIILQ